MAREVVFSDSGFNLRPSESSAKESLQLLTETLAEFAALKCSLGLVSHLPHWNTRNYY